VGEVTGAQEARGRPLRTPSHPSRAARTPVRERGHNFWGRGHNFKQQYLRTARTVCHDLKLERRLKTPREGIVPSPRSGRLRGGACRRTQSCMYVCYCRQLPPPSGRPEADGHPAGSSVAGGHVAPRPPPYRRTAETTRARARPPYDGRKRRNPHVWRGPDCRSEGKVPTRQRGAAMDRQRGAQKDHPPGEPLFRLPPRHRLLRSRATAVDATTSASALAHYRRGRHNTRGRTAREHQEGPACARRDHNQEQSLPQEDHDAAAGATHRGGA